MVNGVEDPSVVLDHPRSMRQLSVCTRRQMKQGGVVAAAQGLGFSAV